MVGGTYCAYRGCTSKTGQNVSFFKFPKDPERSQAWLLVCDREDLLCKTETLETYRLCEKHFETKYFSEGGTRKRLFDQAIPTPFSEYINIEVEKAAQAEKTLMGAQAENIFSSYDPQPGPSCSKDETNQELIVEIADPQPDPSSVRWDIASSSRADQDLIVNVPGEQESYTLTLPGEQESYTLTLPGEQESDQISPVNSNHSFTEKDETVFISPSVSSECGSSKLAFDKQVTYEFTERKQNEMSDIPFADSTLIEISPTIPLQEKIEYFINSIPSSTQSYNANVDSFSYLSSENQEKGKRNLFNKITTNPDAQVTDKCLNEDKDNQKICNYQNSEKTLSESISSGSVYIPSECTTSSFLDNDNGSNEYLDSSENESEPKNYEELLKSKSNEDNIMVTASLQIDKDPQISEETSLKVISSTPSNSSTLCPFSGDKDLCPFCFEQVGHFSRHLFRNHSDEEAVKKILDMPLKSNDRRSAIVLLRRKGNFVLRKEKNVIKPTRRNPLYGEDEKNDENYSVCVNCFGNFKNSYLWRHKKICKSHQENLRLKSRISYRSESQTFLVATGLLGNFINKSRILQVFNNMRADNIGLATRTDVLICLYGESLLGKHKRRQIIATVSQKMRLMAKLKLTLKKTTTVFTLMDILRPEMYDYIIAATKVIAGFDPENLTFKSPSIGLHMGTDLKFICDVAKKAIITKNPLFDFNTNRNEKTMEINALRDMITSHWCNDVSSLANKILNEKKGARPQLLPLTEDVKKFNLFTSTMAENAYQALLNTQNTVENYRTLAQCTLALLLIFNRKRIGEIQYLDINTYEQTSSTVNQEELLSCLTEFEKSMSSSFKRVVVFGKGSKPVPILFTRRLETFTNCLIHIRRTTDIVPKTNKYIFANPNSDRWMAGAAVLRKLAKDCGAKHPELLTSTRFRKQIATILQVMSLEKDELHQIAKFMGHTEKTHLEFYRLSEDLYQTAKVAKLLLLLNAGKGNEFKGKTLAEIEITDDVLDLDENSEKDTAQANFEKSLKLNRSLDQKLDGISNIEDIRSSSRHISEISMKDKHVIGKGRTRWTKKEKKIVLSFFKNHIEEKRPPRKQECLNLISAHPDKFDKSDWVRIKTLIFNTYRVK